MNKKILARFASIGLLFVNFLLVLALPNASVMPFAKQLESSADQVFFVIPRIRNISPDININRGIFVI